MIDQIFDLCVLLLIYGANLLGITYKAVNVWIFVVIWPIFTLVLLALVGYQRRVIQNLLKQAAERKETP